MEFLTAAPLGFLPAASPMVSMLRKGLPLAINCPGLGEQPSKLPPTAWKAPCLLGPARLLWASQGGSLHPKLTLEPRLGGLFVPLYLCAPGHSKEEGPEQDSEASHLGHNPGSAACEFSPENLQKAL